MTSLAVCRDMRLLLQVAVAATCMSCGTFFWESDNRDYTSPPPERIRLVYYSVVRDSTGEVVFEQCFARNGDDESDDEIRAPIGEPYSVFFRNGSRPGKVTTTIDRQDACLAGPSTWNTAYYNGQCLRPRSDSPHQLLNAAVLDESGRTISPVSSTSATVDGHSTRLTLVSSRPGMVVLLTSQKPCVCQGDCLVGYAFNVRELPVN
jgi:hypothetical protein